MTQVMFWRSVQELIRKNKGSGISNSGVQLGHDIAGYWRACRFTPLSPGFSTCTSCCSWLAPGNLSLRPLWPDGLWNDLTFCPQLGVAPPQRQSLNPMKPRKSFSHGTLTYDGTRVLKTGPGGHVRPEAQFSPFRSGVQGSRGILTFNILFEKKKNKDLHLLKANNTLKTTGVMVTG